MQRLSPSDGNVSFIDVDFNDPNNRKVICAPRRGSEPKGLPPLRLRCGSSSCNRCWPSLVAAGILATLAVAAALGLELPSNDMPAVKEARAWLEVAIEPVVMVVQPYVEAAWQQTTTITHAAGKVVVASTQAVAARWATIAALEAEVASLQEEVTRLRAGC